jgi:signal transduction histidine kinase
VTLEQQTGGALQLRIVDDGRGLPDGTMPDGPTSIGLRIAVALAQQLGGRFRLEPAPDGGAMACLDLPQQTR